MMQILSRLRIRIQAIYRMGVVQSIGKEEARRIKVVNIVSAITGWLVIIYGIAFYLLLHSLLILLPALLVFAPSFFGVIWLNGKRRHIAARVAIQAIFISLILYYGSILGRVTEVQLLAVFLMSVALLIWKPQEKGPRIICAAMPILCLVILEFIYYFQLITPLPLSETTQNIYRWMVMPVVLYLNYLAIHLYQDNIMDLLRILRNRNMSLAKSRREVERQRKELEKYSRELEQLVRERTFALIKANNAKTQFISELSHDIRTPLNLIVGMTELLCDTLSSGEPDAPVQARQMARNMQAAGHNILELVNHVLELSKIEAGKTDEVRPEAFSLRDWLRHTVSIYQSVASKQSVTIHLEVDGRFPEQILSDKVMLGQIINNILSNSIKFTPAGKNIRVRCFHQQNRLFLQICDEGKGIPAGQLDAIFEPFEQGDSELYREFGGSGLGLAIAKRKAETMGGNIQVSSTPGEGTNFVITLPLLVSEEVAGLPKPAVELNLLPADTTVVVMDDNEFDHLIMKHFLARIGVTRVAFASDGADGIELARKTMPDVILMDLHMPVLSGRETFLALRADEKLRHIPVVAVSSDAFKEQEAAYIHLGMDGYIRKPVDGKVLHAVLEKLLRFAAQPMTAKLAGVPMEAPRSA
ncbi:ATP-binding response regulator [Chitinophaga rhizosphaerae]|uniref:ATP-binding response regulator n=1 Tax=Chitinophaga rhizosphaerae TaxID=1864947 RepID=UPI000F811002|nr:ATP-binding protein [Chitinophaga rhizosphaerae]